MRAHTFVIVAALALSTAALPYPTEAAQRQRSPGQSRGNGGGGNGGGGGGQSRAAERRAEPRSGGDARREAGGGERQSREARQPRQERQQLQDRQQPELRRQQENRQQPELRQSPDTRSGVRNRGSFDDGRRGDRDRNGDRDRWDGGSGVRPRVAVPRQGPPPRDGNRNGYRVYRPDRRSYNYYNYYPRSLYYRSYPFGYGPGGRGYFYFDGFYNSYVFYPRTVIRYDTYGTYGYPTGELRLQVRPRDAQVFIDGYYAGTVDQFDGIFQSLRLEDGDYHVEIVLPGYEPLDFDVRILPGEKVTYRGELLPELP